jgi:hypothetical protein
MANVSAFWHQVAAYSICLILPLFCHFFELGGLEALLAQKKLPG